MKIKYCEGIIVDKDNGEREIFFKGDIVEIVSKKCSIPATGRIKRVSKDVMLGFCSWSDVIVLDTSKNYCESTEDISTKDIKSIKKIPD